MNCYETQKRLDDFLDGKLDDATRDCMQEHLGRCDDCRSQVAQARALQSALKALPVPPPSAGFEDRVLQRAIDTHRGHVSGRRSGIIVMAMAASLIAGIGIGLQVDRHDPDGIAAQQVTIALQERETVQLVFRSDTAVSDVTFSVLLPEGVELDGFPGRREIAWQGSLEPGANLLSLPLVAHKATRGELLARIRQGGQSRTFTVDVTVKSPDRTDGTRLLYMS